MLLRTVVVWFIMRPILAFHFEDHPVTPARGW